MDLRTSLLQSPKPMHQYHDAISLAWLAANRPARLPKTYKVGKKTINILGQYRPWDYCNDTWFTNNLIRDGIHGFRHVCRVAVHVLSLAVERYNFSPHQLEAIMWAALLHDCRRKNDNTDSRHGLRASLWVGRKNNLIPLPVRHMLPAIQYAITSHNDLYEVIIKRPSYKKFQPFVDILKTADGLDRYRFPRKDWWFSRNYVMLFPGITAEALAFDLAWESESRYLSVKKNSDSMNEAWQKIK